MAEKKDIISTIEADVELEGKYLTFWTDNQLFGMPIRDVLQIINVQQITRIAEFPHYARGVVNLRGTVVPVIDMRLRLGREKVKYSDKTCIIVTNVNDTLVGYIVDAVDEVADIPDKNIALPPRAANSGENNFVANIGKSEGRSVLLLDVSKILSLEEISTLANMIS